MHERKHHIQVKQTNNETMKIIKDKGEQVKSQQQQEKKVKRQESTENRVCKLKFFFLFEKNIVFFSLLML